MKPTQEALDEEEAAFLRDQQGDYDQHHIHEQSSNRWRPAHILRLVAELAMACAIVLLLVARPRTTRSSLRRSPVPQLPRKIYTFQRNARYGPDDMFTNKSTTLHTLHKWIELSSAARGYVVAPANPEAYDLPKPYTIAVDRHTDGPGYMVSVFHQLHCLSYLAVRFQEGYDGVELEDEVAHHAVHCFNYLRQGIMCSADTTLEGKTEAGPGEGSEHECVDYEALLEWANGHAGMQWREGLLPEEATL